MAQPKPRLIRWSPHHSDEFLVAGNDIRLFKIKDKPLPPEEAVTSSDVGLAPPPSTPVVTLMKTFNDTSTMKCLSWCRDKNKSNLVAVGLGTPGKVLLVDMSSDNDGTPGGNATLVKEFMPRHSRNVMAVRWNPVYHNQIAIGQDKARQDECVLVYDVANVPMPSYANSGEIQATRSVAVGANTSTFNITPSVEPAKEEMPIAAVSTGEGVVAMSWLPGQPFCVATGTSFKWLRIYDLRGDRNAPHSVVAHPRGVYGVVYDTLKEQRLATFSDDGNIKVWDMRKLNEATKVIQTGSRGLTEIAWCPTRAGTLASISRGETCVRMWDVERPVTTEASNSAISTSNRSHYSSEPLTSFSWHPRAINRLITLSSTGLVASTDLHECIPLSWSPKGHITFNVGQTLARVDTFNNQAEDISSVMCRRAGSGYSLDLQTNIEILSLELSQREDENLRGVCFVWEWLQHLGRCAPQVKLAGLQGVLDILGLREQSEKKMMAATVKSTTDIPFSTFQSPSRDIVLGVCGWGPNDYKETVSFLREKNLIERAAAIAVWNMDIPLAIQILTDSSLGDRSEGNAGGEASLETDHPDFALIAMVLAGFKVDDSWRALCNRMRWQFKNAYLRGAFAFLATSDNDFAPILEDTDIMLNDRCAFACRYLSDTDLRPFLQNAHMSYLDRGDLAGVVLTGFSAHVSSLLSTFIDRTSDIQTAALVASYTPGKELPEYAAQYITCYRELLNQWEMWHERASFDVSLAEMTRRVTPPQQVSVRCNFCDASVTPSAKPIAPRGRYRGGGAANPHQKPPSRACPACKKPLPRCAVCLLSLGCTDKPDTENRKQHWSPSGADADFDRWFTWCQTCRHGGHATHLSSWFQSHSECPVTGCLCQCLNRDFSTTTT